MESCNRLKTAFKQGKQSMGLWQMIPGANVSRLLARSGVDWVMVDCEHGNIDGEYGLYSFALPLFSFCLEFQPPFRRAPIRVHGIKC